MSTCNRLDLQTLGCRPIMPKNVPDHWFDGVAEHGEPPAELILAEVVEWANQRKLFTDGPIEVFRSERQHPLSIRSYSVQ